MKKKIFVILLALLIIIPINASAKTLGEYKKDLDEEEALYQENQDKIARTDAEIAAANERVQDIYFEIDVVEEDMRSIGDEIAKLNADIAKKDSEIKELMKYYQFSSGESVYLEYLFSANSITDFIYRFSITEQLSKYNDELIDEMNDMIERNKENIKNLQEKEESLKGLQQELKEQLVILGSQREQLGDESITIQEEIDARRAIVEQYEALGCSDDQDVTTCGRTALPVGTKFYRPLSVGYVTDEYGYRYDPFTGEWGNYHSGTDMSSYSSCWDCQEIYSVATGVVGTTGYTSFWGNYAIVWHNINGQNYSSLYMHMSEVYVSDGQEVTKDTVIGHMGNTGLSTATHLHLTILTCHLWEPGDSCSYPEDTTDSRNYINYPSSFYVDWNDRYSYYD